MKTIYALDLGKFNTVSCLLTEDHSSIPVFKTIMTNSKTYKQFLLDFNPSLLGVPFPSNCTITHDNAGWTQKGMRNISINA